MAVFGLRRHETGFRIQRVDLDHSIFEIFQALKGRYLSTFLLESVEGPEGLAEYSFLGFDPALMIEVYREYTRIARDGSIEELDGDPLDTLKELVAPSRKIAYAPRFVGGLVGYVSYESCYLWNGGLELVRELEADLPMMRFGLFDDSLVYDHVNRTYYYCYLGESRLPELIKALKDGGDGEGRLTYSGPRSNLSKDEFMKIVEAGKDYIEAGEIFQVVLSRRLEFTGRGDLLPFYKALREMNPSPYMYYVRLMDEELVGSSPEMLIRVQGNTAVTFPIAGTRPRMRDPEEEARSDEELMRDEKERAEHVMLVDLARNDLGVVAEPGSVKVAELMKLVKYSHVKHLVSRVEARLRPGMDMYHAFKSVFPAGTVSGAPKPRAMEIINELEPVDRGAYSGAVGYFSYSGCCDFAITIRTLVRRGDHASIQAGAGIVWDSVPEREWMETQHKMMALLKALEEVAG
ncbi:MAG: anthranilate synthase component I family protein [Aigarchaeota archaeon]|nr:anthranilate synthase component I family protein [Aigarchaeota archaeon]